MLFGGKVDLGRFERARRSAKPGRKNRVRAPRRVATSLPRCLATRASATWPRGTIIGPW